MKTAFFIEPMQQKYLTSILYAGTGFGVLCIAAFFLMLARKHQVTAWNPPGLPSIIMWVLGPLLMLTASAAAGWYDIQEWPTSYYDGGGISILIGVGFVSISLMLGKVRNLRQRRAAGRRDGRAYYPGLFRLLLAFFGPIVGLYLLQQLYLLMFGRLFDFNQSFVIALHVVGWTAVIWQRPVPIAVYCMLHEVIPYGGIDGKGDTALSFEEAPEGSLRINPDDAANLGIETGDQARIVTAVGSAMARVEVTDRMLPGHVAIPNGFGLDNEDGTRSGVAPNELTSLSEAEDSSLFLPFRSLV